MYLVNASLALSNIADIKERISEDPRTNWMKSFDVFGMESVNDESAKKYIKTLVDSAINELKKAKP